MRLPRTATAATAHYVSLPPSVRAHPIVTWQAADVPQANLSIITAAQQVPRLEGAPSQPIPLSLVACITARVHPKRERCEVHVSAVTRTTGGATQHFCMLGPMTGPSSSCDCSLVTQSGRDRQRVVQREGKAEGWYKDIKAITASNNQPLSSNQQKERRQWECQGGHHLDKVHPKSVPGQETNSATLKER